MPSSQPRLADIAEDPTLARASAAADRPTMRISPALLLVCALVALSGRGPLSVAAAHSATHNSVEKSELPSIGRTLARIFLYLPRRVVGLASRLYRLLRTGKWETAVEEDFPLKDAKELVGEALSAAIETAHAAQDAVEEAYHEVESAVHEVFESEHEQRDDEEPAPSHGEEPAEEIIEGDHHDHHHDEE